jgi:hypothetical protein
VLEIDPDIFGVDVLQGNGKEILIKGFQYADIGIDVSGIRFVGEEKFLFSCSDIIGSVFVVEDVFPILLEQFAIIAEGIIFGREIIGDGEYLLDKRFFEKPEKVVVASGNPESSHERDVEIQDLLHELGFLFYPFGDFEAFDIFDIFADRGHQIIQILCDLLAVFISEYGDDIFMHALEEFFLEVSVIGDIEEKIFHRAVVFAEAVDESIQDLFIIEFGDDGLGDQKHI